MHSSHNSGISQCQPRLFSALEEAQLCHSHEDSDGYFSHLVRLPSGFLNQKSYHINHLPEVLNLLDENRDNYISVAEFWSPIRKVVNVKSVEEIFRDIDCLGLAWATGRTPEELAQIIRYECGAEGFPEPSIINWSGRGMHLKWLLTKPLPHPALVRWNIVQEGVIKRFERFGADPKAKDAARVLRCVETINEKNLQRCRTLDYASGESGGIKRYDFEYLAEYFMPYSREQARSYKREKQLSIEKKRNAHPELAKYTLQTLSWARVDDLGTLLDIRGVIPEGMRMNYALIFLSELALSGVVTPATFWEEAAYVAKKVDPAWNCRSAEFRTLYAKVLSAVKGEKVRYNGRETTPIYTYSTQKIIETLKITPDEEKEMHTLVSEAVLHRRRMDKQTAARREAGIVERSEYLARSIARKDLARSLAKEGFGVREIARKMNLNHSTISKYLK